MEEIYIKARAKINLALDILGKRLDGYHEMEMIMQTLRLHDIIYIKKIDTPKIILSSNHKWLPLDNRNLVYRAAEILIKEHGIKEGVFINIKKTIPISAGLAGGSSDCASALISMCRLFELTIDKNELNSIGKLLGADIPYCLMRGTALAQGIGGNLTMLSPHPDIHVLVVKPPIRVSTAQVFNKYKAENVKHRPDIPKMIGGINEGNIEKIAKEFCNVLESVTERQHPVIAKIKKIMLENDAIGALMTGSGPTVFGYFKTKAEAKEAIAEIKLAEPYIYEIFLTSIYNPMRKGMNIEDDKYFK